MYDFLCIDILGSNALIVSETERKNITRLSLFNKKNAFSS